MSHFEGFEEVYVPVKSDLAGDLKIRTLHSGSKGGPPLVLLHGYPQTSYIFHKIANKLVDAGYTLIIPDLRGYGKSSKPKAGEKHEEYSKREMANDIIQVAKHFGYERFDLVAHDRGARVAHRLCLDHPKAVRNLMLLDIAPTLFMFESTDQEFATRYWHWFFQLLPTAEALIAADPETYFKTATWNYEFDPVARKEYFDSFSSPEGIHGSCEDYRAAASIDLEHDRADRKAGKKMQVEKLRVLWGSQGLIPKYGDVPGVWKQYCDDSVDVSGRAVESNHYIPDMAPDDLYNEILELVPLK